METDRERIAELVRQLQSGNGSAFDELYKLTSSRAYFVALEITKNEQDAEDILQESYIKMLEKINALDKPESFASWFNQIVANRSKDSLKKKKPTLFEGGEDEAFGVIPDEDTSFSPEENLNQDELRRAVMEVIEELTEEKRACVMMMYFEEMSVNEIAETLEIPVSTVKNRLFTARKDLKAKFEKRGITSVYSAAPIGVIIWAISKTSDAVATAFSASAASSKVLAGVTAASSTVTTAAGMTATAGTAGGIAAKAAALTVAQKVVAGVAAVAVVSGSAAGVATVVNGRDADETTTAYTEEVTTSPDFVTTQVIEAIVMSTATETSTMPVTEKEKTTEKTEPVATTAKPETTAAQTQPKTTSVKKTKPSTTRRNYFPSTTTLKATTTTLKATTTVRMTEKTTEEETTEYREETRPVITQAPTTEATTTLPAPATVVISFYDMNNDVIDTATVTVPAGTEMTQGYLVDLVLAQGYEPTAGIVGDALGAVAQPGQSYSLEAYL